MLTGLAERCESVLRYEAYIRFSNVFIWILVLLVGMKRVDVQNSDFPRFVGNLGHFHFSAGTNFDHRTP
jgi:hypothetical protein